MRVQSERERYRRGRILTGFQALSLWVLSLAILDASKEVIVFYLERIGHDLIGDLIQLNRVS